jgi:hypothetical protein
VLAGPTLPLPALPVPAVPVPTVAGPTVVVAASGRVVDAAPCTAPAESRELDEPAQPINAKPKMAHRAAGLPVMSV